LKCKHADGRVIALELAREWRGNNKQWRTDGSKVGLAGKTNGREAAMSETTGDLETAEIPRKRKTPGPKPKELSPQLKAQFASLLRVGLKRSEACHALDVTPAVLKRTYRRCGQFMADIIQAESVRDAKLHRIAYDKAVEGDAAMLRYLISHAASQAQQRREWAWKRMEKAEIARVSKGVNSADEKTRVEAEAQLAGWRALQAGKASGLAVPSIPPEPPESDEPASAAAQPSARKVDEPGIPRT